MADDCEVRRCFPYSRMTDEELPEERPESERALHVLPDPGWRVILFNDDLTPFDIVIIGLMRAAGLSAEVSEMVALEAHGTGAAVVRRGLQEDEARIMCGRLKAFTRVPGLCPGVDCEAEREEA